MLFERLFSIIAPHSCLACSAEGHLLCAHCAGQLPAAMPRCYRCTRPQPHYQTCAHCQVASPLAGVWAVTPYQDFAKAVLHRLKFERSQAAANDIAVAMANRLPATDANWLISYVPTAPARVRQRGYDQARLIARALARHTGFPYLPLLARSGNQRQLGQRRAVRRTQLQAAFRATRQQHLATKSILLVDDVITTGATFEAAAYALRAAGAIHVSAIAFAAA